MNHPTNIVIPEFLQKENLKKKKPLWKKLLLENKIVNTIAYQLKKWACKDNDYLYDGAPTAPIKLTVSSVKKIEKKKAIKQKKEYSDCRKKDRKEKRLKIRMKKKGMIPSHSDMPATTPINVQTKKEVTIPKHGYEKQNGQQTDTAENIIHQKIELLELEKDIVRYFCLDNPELREYYFTKNRWCEAEEPEIIVKTYTKYVANHYDPKDIEMMKNKLQKHGIEFHISYSNNNENGIVTVRNTTYKDEVMIETTEDEKGKYKSYVDSKRKAS